MILVILTSLSTTLTLALVKWNVIKAIVWLTRLFSRLQGIIFSIRINCDGDPWTFHRVKCRQCVCTGAHKETGPWLTPQKYRCSKEVCISAICCISPRMGKAISVTVYFPFWWKTKNLVLFLASFCKMKWDEEPVQPFTTFCFFHRLCWDKVLQLKPFAQVAQSLSLDPFLCHHHFLPREVGFLPISVLVRHVKQVVWLSE